MISNNFYACTYNILRNKFRQAKQKGESMAKYCKSCKCNDEIGCESKYSDCCKSEYDSCCKKKHHHKHHCKCCCCVGPRGETGPRGFPGPQGPPGELVTTFMQVFDEALTSSIAADDTNIQLTTLATNIFQLGGFSISTSTIANDTINFPDDDTGVYKVDAVIDFNFIANTATSGTTYDVTIGATSDPAILDIPDVTVSNAIGTEGVANGSSVAMSFLLEVPSTPFTLTFQLVDFDFTLSANALINITSIAVNIIKISDEIPEIVI